MKITLTPPRLLLVGISIRLLCAVIVLVVLWAGLFWATSTPVSL